MSQAFRGVRLNIAVLGRCNTGKSTLLNHITGQQAAIVSPQPGTTGDPVAIPFELLPYGPVTFHDTAGLDEASELGLLRRKAGRKILALADMALVVTDEQGLGEWERSLVADLRALETPLLVVFNKRDIAPAPNADTTWCREHDIPFFEIAAATAPSPEALRECLIRLAPAPEALPPIVRDVLPEQATVLCVTPIDASAPKGRLIAPQVQVLRELLDARHIALVVQDGDVRAALDRLRTPPDLVITDSQAVRAVSAAVPQDVPLTTFSLLFARLEGDFSLLLHGAETIDSLRRGDRVLIAEACSHHAQDDDIARVKLPALLRKHAGNELRIAVSAGRDFPDDVSGYALVVHCGGCMLGRGEMRRRLRICAAAGTPVTNFGMALSHMNGVLTRVAAPLAAPRN